MSDSLTIEVPEVFANAWRKLPPSQQSSLVDFAAYLAAQVAEQRLDDKDEAAWDRRFADPAASARFLEWGQQALAGAEDEPLDLKRL